MKIKKHSGKKKEIIEKELLEKRKKEKFWKMAKKTIFLKKILEI